MSQNVEITLPYSTLSVQGTVNGKVVTWINIIGNTWQAVADRAADDIYVLELQVTSDNGVTTNLQAVLFYSGLSLVTDRTAADVARWKELRDKGFASMNDEEKAEWLGNMKGCYGAKDMNRVEGAVALLSNRLAGLGYLSSPSVKMNWANGEIPTREDMERYFGNIEKLRNLLPLRPGTPAAPSIGDRLDYRIANDMETILLNVNYIAEIIPKTWCYSGEIFAEGGIDNVI